MSTILDYMLLPFAICMQEALLYNRGPIPAGNLKWKFPPINASIIYGCLDYDILKQIVRRAFLQIPLMRNVIELLSWKS